MDADGWTAHYWPDLDYAALTRPYNNRPDAVVMEFRLYQTIGTDAATGGAVFKKPDYSNPGDATLDVREARLCASGSVKWDGCSDVWFDEMFDEQICLHFCGLDYYRSLFKVFEHLYQIASQTLPDWNGDR